MSEPSSPPRSLKVVAALFLVLGTLSAVEILWTAVHTAQLSLDLGVLYLLIGYGLLRRKSLWRQAALVAAWATVVTYPLLLGIAFAYYPTVELNVSALGQSLAPHSPSALMVAVGAVLAIIGASSWVIWTLERDLVRQQFASS